MYTYCLWVGQRPEPVVVLLSCCIPQAQVYWFPINHHIGRVVVEAVKKSVGDDNDKDVDNDKPSQPETTPGLTVHVHITVIH